MKRFILSMFVMVSFIFYVFSQNGANSVNAITASSDTPSANSVAVNTNLNTNTKKKVTKTVDVAISPVINNPTSKPVSKNPNPTPAPVITPPKKNGIYTDGQYTGSSADAYYGNIQVQAVITNGALTDVIFLDHPQDRGTSVRINNRAMPILRSEAIQSQSANVVTVSGATDSSGAFRESLAAALAQAKA